ncbi:MAG TPA: S8 family peptidase, partial [Dissulfurispiraceae bacterium]|nr:S8 family peptidase [Dissulfurispiraceae bacterium]
MKRAYSIKSLILCLLMVFLTSGHLYGGSEGRAGQTTGTPGSSTENTPEFKDGELIVKFKSRVSKSKKDKLHAINGSKIKKEYTRFDIDHVEIKKGMTVKDAMAMYEADPDVLYAEPNYMVRIEAIPNDAFFNQSWGLLNTGQTGGTPGADIDAPNAWNITTGSANVVVAVIDTGVDYGHADLSANIWVNTGEIAGNGIDDDGNGYVDDIHGIDTMNNDSDPFDDNGHGTHVAGIIGAQGNNAVGVAGLNWNVSILACKFVDANGYGFIDGAIRCLDYVKALKASGVNIVATNNSWAGFAYSQALYDAINAQRDILFFAAAGNGGGYNDTDPLFPASYFLPNVVSVTATDDTDGMPWFSNFGRRSVHLGAPGESILSTLPAVNYFNIPGGYGSYSGTSMATPHVTGVAALLKAQNPASSWIDIKNLILSGGDTVASMTGNTLTGRRLNAFGSLSCVSSPLFSAIAFPTVFTAGTQEFLAALSINCASSVGPVTVTSSASETITLRDDGVAPDLAAGDGIFSASWKPASPYTNLAFTSPAGSETVEAPVPDPVITAV